jgi:hypothetical protein
MAATRRLGLIALVVVLSASACQSPGPLPVAGLQISNLKVGLMRKIGDEWVVYQEGFEFPYRANGECVANLIKQPCMWWGHTFEYKNAALGTEIPCEQEFSRPQRRVTPDSDHGLSSRHNFVLRLKETDGVQLALGYLIRDEGDNGKFSIKTICSWNGKTLYEFTKSVEYPAT